MQIFKELDPIALACLFHMATHCKSTAIALCTLYGHIPIEEAVLASRVDENFQVSKWGAVDGAHDLDEANMHTVFGSA